MKRGDKLWKISIATLVASAVLQATAPLPRDWRYEQRFSIADAGLVKLNLPSDTLDAAQPGLEDLRLYDDAGNEIPFLIERPARAETSDPESIPRLAQPVTITGRQSSSGETRLSVNLGAANLTIAEVRVETDDPLFTRAVKVSSEAVEGDSVRESTIGQGQIYRLAVEGQPPSMNLSIPIERQVLSRELLVLIRDESSPPLHVIGIHVERRPVYLVFVPRRAGTYHLLFGNRNVGAPRYDVQRFGATLKDAAVSSVQLSALMDNPDYRARETLPGLEATGAALNVSGWKFRKPIRLANGSVHQLEMDMDVLSHADSGLADLRVVQGEAQVPYLLQRTSIAQKLTPVVTVTNDPKKPKQSRWTVKLPQPRLPLARVVCITKTPVFQRELWVSEDFTDERGNVSHRVLGRGTWTQTPERESREFALTLDVPPRSDTLFVETDNGDNPPIELEKIEAAIPVTRILFEAKPGDRLSLYYGNPKVSPPQYDLSLVARELIDAKRADASLGAEERLQKDSWTSNVTPGKGGVLFWGVLALVVIVLLVLISRMLPKPTPTE